MSRTVKPCRREALLKAAMQLFNEKGADNIAIEEITRGAGVAKGTFYLYFASKKELIAALASDAVEQMAANVAEVISQTQLAPLDKFVMAIAQMKQIDHSSSGITQALHHQQNRELHEHINAQLVLKLGPLLATIVQQGCDQQVFNVDDPLSTLQFILAGQAFLLGSPGFQWTPAQTQAHVMAALTLMERSLGTTQGQLSQPLLAVLA